MEELSDEELMRLAIEGNKKAFGVVYDRWAPRLAGFFLTRCGDQATAGDLTQEVFLRLAEKPTLFDPDRRFAPWIFAVALNRLRNHYRSANRVYIPVESLSQKNSDTHNASPDQQVDNARFASALERALNQLEPYHREVVLLRFREQLSLQEIAEVLGIPEGTVKSRLFYAIRYLGNALRAFKP